MILYAVISTSYLLYFFNSEKVKYYILILYIIIYTALQLSFRLQHPFVSRFPPQKMWQLNSTIVQYLLQAFLNSHIVTVFASL